MTIGGADSVFVDTSALVHATEERSPLYEIARETMGRLYVGGSDLWLSRQILREYLAVQSRPQTWGDPQPMARLLADVTQLTRRFQVAEDGPDVAGQLFVLLRRVRVGGKQIHDANIVATMLAYSIPRLLTHNVDDFVRFAAYIEVIPLTSR